MKFCHHCGQQLSIEVRFCDECGVEQRAVNQKAQSGQQSLPVNGEAPFQSATKEQLPRKKRSKKQVFLYSSLGLALILAVVFYQFGTNAYSYDRTIERYLAAVEERDEETLAELSMHIDGGELQSYEAQALMKLLIKENPRELRAELNENWDYERFHVKTDGKFLGLFDKYLVEVTGGYVELPSDYAGVIYELNGQEWTPEAIEDGEETLTYGPLAPGEYVLKAELKNEFGEASTEEEFTVSSFDTSHVSIDFEGHFATFYKNDSHGIKTSIRINDTDYEMEDGDLQIGPIDPDDSLTFQVVKEFPWGSSETESIKLGISSYGVDDYPVNLNDELQETMVDLVSEYSDSWIQSMNEQDRTLLKTNNPLLKEALYIDDEDPFIGQIDEIYVAFNDVHHYVEPAGKTMLQIPVKLTGQMDYQSNFEYRGDGKLSNQTYECDLIVDYIEEKWHAYDCDFYNYYSYNSDSYDNQAFEGSSTLFGEMFTLETASANESTSSDEEDLEEALSFYDQDLEFYLAKAVEDYLEAFVGAINNEDPDRIYQHATDNGTIANEVPAYVESLIDRGITESLESFELVSYEELGDLMYRVTVEDAYTIYHPDREEYKEFTSIFTLEYYDDWYWVHDLISTVHTNGD